jgi:tetratricopeptide (TPR) repeat protein
MSRVRTNAAERGGALDLANILGQASMDLELLAGDPAAAAAFGQEAMGIYEEIEERGFASTAAGILAQALYALDRLDEAAESARVAAKLGASDDVLTQILWRQVKAKLLARRGDHGSAQRLAREAVALGNGTDLLNYVADAYSDLGEVLELGGRTDEAAIALAEALARYERKENLVMAERTRTRLAELRAARAR